LLLRQLTTNSTGRTARS